nr:SO_0444 family Cu/Zn efflux transporter [Desulforhopalus sp. IMCC35007]
MLPAAASLRKQGANKGATTAFLISTPESGVDSIAVTYALLDPLMTIVRPVAAFVTAVVAGIAENTLFWKNEQKTLVVDRKCPVDGCCDGVDCPDEIHRHHHSYREKVVAGLRFSYQDVWGDIAVWFFIGVFIAAFITVLVPDEVMATFLGGGVQSMLLMLVVGIPLYICATASTPVAAALILKGVSPGTALVFLLVGPATNITSLSVLFGLLGKKSTVLYLASLSFCAVLFGLGVDWLYSLLDISPVAILGEATEVIPESVRWLSALLLLAFSVQPLRFYIKKLLSPTKKQTTFISGFPIAGENMSKRNHDSKSTVKPTHIHNGKGKI